MEDMTILNWLYVLIRNKFALKSILSAMLVVLLDHLQAMSAALPSSALFLYPSPEVAYCQTLASC